MTSNSKPKQLAQEKENSMFCILCTHNSARRFLSVDSMDYWRCERCLATFLDPSQMPSLEVERHQYQMHENDPADDGYRHFLSRLAEPLLQVLPPQRQGLDFGCGPGPALAMMMEEAGHQVALYDPFFYPHEEALQQQYDFITCTEVVEHFHRPARQFELFEHLLKPQGWLAIMTCFQTDDEAFAHWHYRRDPTHVIFYREETFHTLADDFGWHCETDRNIALLQKR